MEAKGVTRPLAASPSPRPLNRPQQLPAAICPSCGVRLRTHRQEGRGASPPPANSAGARASGGVEGAQPPPGPCRGPAKRGPKG